MKDSIEISKIAEMWGTIDERIGVRLDNGEIWFVQEIRIYRQFMLGDFNKN